MTIVRLSVGVLAAAVVVVAAGSASKAAPRADDVTLRLTRTYDAGNRITRFRFSGTVANGRANEYVAVLQRPCGSPNTTAVAGATTRTGGSWDAEPAGSAWIGGSAAYWARWEGRLSEPVVYRAPVPVSLTALSPSSYRVTINTTTQSMRGKRIELQRLSGGSWKRASVATLRGSSGRFTTTVATTGRNVTYRIHVPVVAARPCHAATSTDAFVVGRPPAPGSETVIDRTLSCAVEMRGGLHMVEVHATSARLQPPEVAASFSVTTHFVPDWTLASAWTTTVQFNPKRCTAARARPALSSVGLSGGPVDTESEYECETPARVLIRVRATFRLPSKFAPDRSFGYVMQQARGDVKEAAVVVLTLSGRRVALATFSGGKARLFTAASCVEDDNG